MWPLLPNNPGWRLYGFKDSVAHNPIQELTTKWCRNAECNTFAPEGLPRLSSFWHMLSLHYLNLEKETGDQERMVRQFTRHNMPGQQYHKTLVYCLDVLNKKLQLRFCRPLPKNGHCPITHHFIHQHHQFIYQYHTVMNRNNLK